MAAAVLAAVVLFMPLRDWIVPWAADQFFAESATRTQNAVDDKLDREGDAFTVSVRDGTESEQTIYTLDRPITGAERQTLYGLDLRSDEGDRVFENLVTSRAKKLAYSLEKADGFSKIWLMDFHSDRDTELSVIGLRAKNLRCTTASAKVIFLFPQQGGGVYEGMFFDLPEKDTPTITGSDKNRGKPFFSFKKIDLGGSATPGGLRVEVSSGTSDCRWVFEATYSDSAGTHTQEITNGGEPFAIDGIPAGEAQRFVVDPGAQPGQRYVIDCAETQTFC
ncbi:hypothetical protein ACFWR6_16775 [Streptomyces griseus]|uniref:hypothetical protein n=1 Tax=Streptomyces griseus TaxID=1911 RepID=UPI00365EA557